MKSNDCIPQYPKGVMASSPGSCNLGGGARGNWGAVPPHGPPNISAQMAHLVHILIKKNIHKIYYA